MMTKSPLVAILVLLSLVFACPPTMGASTAVPEEDGRSARFRVAQAEDSREGNIFEQLKIELVELKEMSRIFSERLQGESVRMSLDEAVQRALESNQDILIISYEPLKSEADITSTRGEFDPQFSSRVNYSDASLPASPSTILFSGGAVTSIDQRLTDYSLSVGGKLHWGTQYNLELSTVREQGTFVIDPVSMRADRSEYNTGATLSLTQPILSGFGKASNLARVRSARVGRDISESQLRLTVLNSIGDVIKAYWDLVGTIETLRVRRESLANAERLVEINEQRLQIGTAAAIEVLQAKAQAASRYGDLVSAQTAIADAEDILKNLMGMQNGELFSSKSIVPTDRPRVTKIDWDLGRSTEAALANRPEVYSAELAVRTSEIELARSRRDRRPTLDLETSYGQQGRSFDADRSFSDAITQEGEVFTIGLSGSIPIMNRAARGAFRRAQLEVRQAGQQLQKAKRDVLLGVRISLRAVATNEILVESTRQARILQEANVAAEEKRLFLGVTTSQDLLDIQEDLTAAQTQEVRTTINLEKSVIDLQVSEGTLLKNLNIEFEDALPTFKATPPPL